MKQLIVAILFLISLITPIVPLHGTIQSTNGFWLPAPTWGGATTAPVFATTTFDGAADRFAVIARASETCALDQIAFSVGAITTNAALDARIETVSTTTANPSGTLWAANTTGTVAVPTADAINVATLTANASVTRGNIFAIVVQPNTTPISLELNRFAGTSLASGAYGFPYGNINTAGSYAASTSTPNFAVHCSGGSWMYLGEGAIAAETISSNVFNTGTGATTGTRRGIRFQLPFPTRLGAVGFKGTIANGADLTVVLYNGTTGASITTLATVDGNNFLTTAANQYTLITDSDASISANTPYYVAIVAGTANNITTYNMALDSSAHLTALAGGTNIYSVNFISGVWVEDTANRPFMWLHFNGFDDADCGGGGGSTTNCLLGAGF